MKKPFNDKSPRRRRTTGTIEVRSIIMNANYYVFVAKNNDNLVNGVNFIWYRIKKWPLFPTCRRRKRPILAIGSI